MKFKSSIDINQPKEKVAALWADPNNLKEWQDDFVKKELISKTEGEEGAISKMYYKADGRDMELTETVISNQLPDTFEGHYHHKHMDNTMKSSFVALSVNQTRYETEIEYTRINWIMPKLMALLFPSMFRKQVEKWMKNFKAFVENQ